MLEAVCYGLVAASGFVGFVSVVYFVLLYIYRADEKSCSIVHISPDSTRHEINNILIGVHIRQMLFGNAFGFATIIVDNGWSDFQRKTVEAEIMNYTNIRICKAEDLCTALQERD